MQMNSAIAKVGPQKFWAPPPLRQKLRSLSLSEIRISRSERGVWGGEVLMNIVAAPCRVGGWGGMGV